MSVDLSLMELVICLCWIMTPGFIIKIIVDAFSPSRRDIESVLFLKIVIYGMLNFVLWIWLYIIIQEQIENIVLYYIVQVAALILTSTIVGCIIGFIRSKNVVRALLMKIGIQTEHHIPTAWDYKFSETKEPRWIIVTLSNDKIIRGFYGKQSFASSDESQQDIYLEKVYVMNEKNGSWTEVERTDGILIKASEIKMIEFKM